MRLAYSRGLGVDELLTVFDAKRALATKLQPKFVWYYLLTC